MKLYFYLSFALLYFFLKSDILIAQSVSEAQWISQDTTVARIYVAADWGKGEKKKYRVYKITKKFKEDSLLSTKTDLDCIVQFEVSDSTAESYEMSYRMLKNKRDTSQDPTLPFDQLNINEQDLILHYSTDNEGVLKKYKNRESVEGKLDDMVQLMVTKVKEDFKAKDESEKKVFGTVLDKMANGKVLFSTMYEVFVSQFHNFHGYSSGINDTLRYNESVPHSFGTTPINYDCYTYITSIDSTYEARFDIEKYADMKGFLNDYTLFLTKAKQDAGAKGNEQFDKELAALNMKMETYVTYFVDLNTGWPTFLKLTKSVITKDEVTNSTYYQDEIYVLTDNLEDQ
jgi:hypothetical protein